MEWKPFAHLRDAGGGPSVEVDVAEDATVGRALEALVEARPALREELFEDGELADLSRLLVDGEPPEAGLATAVDGETELALFPPVSGG